MAAELDPQARSLLDRLAEAGAPPPHQCTPEQARANYEAGTAALCGSGPELAEVSDRDADGVPVRVYRPANAAMVGPALVYLHGGGWVVGSLNSHDTLCRVVAERSGAVVLAVGYRLAPDHRYPAALEDTLIALRWVAKNATDLGVDAARIVLGGDSAGGNLAAAAALQVRGELQLTRQVLIYPVTDTSFDRDSYRRNGEGYFLTEADMRWYWEHYAGDADRSDPGMAPLRATDLSGTAPALLIVAGYDPLRDEGLEYGQRLRDAGVEVEVVEFEGQIHGFARWFAVFDKADEAADLVATALRSA